MWASEATHRDTTTTYVPVNDSAPLSRRPGKAPSPQQVHTGLQLLPENRPRQARQFPVAIPRDPAVYLVWPADPPPEGPRGAEIPLRQGNPGGTFGLIGAGLGRGHAPRSQPGSNRGVGPASAAGIRPRPAWTTWRLNTKATEGPSGRGGFPTPGRNRISGRKYRKAPSTIACWRCAGLTAGGWDWRAP